MEISEALDAEKEAVARQPAVFINRFFVSSGPGIARLSFLETDPEKRTHVRYAIALTETDALELARMLLLLCQNNDNTTNKVN